MGVSRMRERVATIRLSALWASLFTLQAVLLAVAGIARRDLVIRPRWDLSSGLGAVFIAYALIGYPLVGVLGGHPLRVVPLFGVSPCATVTFFFGLLLWAVPPVPKYLLLVPLAWALNAAPGNMALGVVVDYGMLAAALVTAGWILWRDRATGPAWHPVTAGLLFALMIAWSGHDDVLIGTAVVMLAVMLAVTLPKAITGHARHARRDPTSQPGQLQQPVPDPVVERAPAPAPGRCSVGTRHRKRRSPAEQPPMAGPVR
jgi:hypothetical protein